MSFTKTNDYRKRYYQYSKPVFTQLLTTNHTTANYQTFEKRIARMAKATPKRSKQAKAVTSTAAAQRTRRGGGQDDAGPQKRLDDPEALIRKRNRIAKASKGSADRRKPSQQVQRKSTVSANQRRQQSLLDAAVQVQEPANREETSPQSTENATGQQEQHSQAADIIVPEVIPLADPSLLNSVPNGEIENEAQEDDDLAADDKKRKRDDDTKDEESPKRSRTVDDDHKNSVKEEVKLEDVPENDAQAAPEIPTEASHQMLPTTPAVPLTPPPTSKSSSRIPESSVLVPAAIPVEPPQDLAPSPPAIPTPPPTASRPGSFLGSLLGEFGGTPIGRSDKWRPPGRMTRRPSWEGRSRTNSQQAREHTNQAREIQGLATESPRTSVVTTPRPSNSGGVTPSGSQPAAAVLAAIDSSDTSDEDEDPPVQNQQPSLRDRLLAATESSSTLNVEHEDADERGGADENTQDDNDNYSPPTTSSSLTLAQLVDREQQRQYPEADSSAALLEEQLEAALTRDDTPEARRQRSSTQHREGSVATSDHAIENDVGVQEALEAAGNDVSQSGSTPTTGFSRVLDPEQPIALPVQMQAPVRTYGYVSGDPYDEEDQVDYGDDDDDFDAIYHD